MKASLPKDVLQLAQIDIDGTGMNTLSIIEEAKNLKRKHEERHLRAIDKVWAVFDKDDFLARNFNDAINKGENSKPKIHCA